MNIKEWERKRFLEDEMFLERENEKADRYTDEVLTETILQLKEERDEARAEIIKLQEQLQDQALQLEAKDEKYIELNDWIKEAFY